MIKLIKPIIHRMAVALACIAISTPLSFSQGRPRDMNGHRERISNQSQHKEKSARTQNTRPNTIHNTGQRPGNGNVGNHRPGSNKPGNGNVGNHRPGSNKPGNGNVGNHRPGSNKPGSGNVGNHRPGSNKPGSGNVGNHRPGNNGFRPGTNHKPRPPYLAPTHRPHRPIMHRPHHRPLPPPGWRPHGRIPVVRGILGLTFGTAIGISLDYLLSSGYTVDGYSNDVVYLRNVSALNYIWTDAALYYGTGGLDASSFYYSTPRYDLARYNNVYNSLVATYGTPISMNNSVNSIGATWFGGNNGYITLSFGANNMGSGLRYLTTLTFGL